MARIRQIRLAKNEAKPEALVSLAPHQLTLDLSHGQAGCNYRCRGCIDNSVAGKNLVEMPQEIFRDLLDYAKINRLVGFMFYGREPLMHPLVNTFLNEISETELAVRLVTNGSLLRQHENALFAACAVQRGNGSGIRVSVNADENNYPRLTRQTNVALKMVLSSISSLVKKGALVGISTVVQGQSAGQLSNIGQLPEIVRLAKQAGASLISLIPYRNPESKKVFSYTPSETDFIKALAGEQGITLGPRFFSSQPVPEDNYDFPCLASLLAQAVIYPDGTIGGCTERRGEETAIIGQMTPTCSFSTAWHSQKRVRKQQEILKICQGKDCDRYHRVHVPILTGQSLEHFSNFI
ncbi:hypothetical protein A2548_05960 [candidate division WOR-1 bacterium RIFOXYD2_FULL_41_8]|nr:MAG: hypothetical protein A2548_05960 [candidate division WOR-1 bacterium RIFOXYD2_FULL_41_8]